MTDPYSGPPPAAERPAPALERLAPRVVPYWYLSDLLGTIVRAARLFGGTLWLRERTEWWAPVLRWGALGLVAASLVWTLVSPPLAFVRWAFAVDDELLQMRYGIVFHEERVVPVRRMQHVDLVRGPLERLFGLATLVVFTAGNEGSAFRVPGLLAARAAALRDRILRARGDDVL